MKLNIKNIATICSIILIMDISCKKKSPCDYDFPPTVNVSSISIIFKDAATGKYLYPELFPTLNYNIDSIKIYNQNNSILSLIKTKTAVPNQIAVNYWDINLGPIYDYRTDSVSFQQPTKRLFFIKYNSTEIDTISTEFKSSYTQCGSYFEYLKIYYKKQLLDSVKNETFIRITINK